MFKYDQNTGADALIGDSVEICHTASNMDGLTGRIGGWGDQFEQIALVILDRSYKLENSFETVEVISMPVVCLREPEDD